jgi:hypothetical protein
MNQLKVKLEVLGYKSEDLDHWLLNVQWLAIENTAEPRHWLLVLVQKLKQYWKRASPIPFLLPISSRLNTLPPLGIQRSAHSSFSFNSSICSSVKPCIFGGNMIPCWAKHLISGKNSRTSTMYRRYKCWIYEFTCTEQNVFIVHGGLTIKSLGCCRLQQIQYKTSTYMYRIQIFGVTEYM